MSEFFVLFNDFLTAFVVMFMTRWIQPHHPGLQEKICIILICARHFLLHSWDYVSLLFDKIVALVAVFALEEGWAALSSPVVVVEELFCGIKKTVFRKFDLSIELALISTHWTSPALAPSHNFANNENVLEDIPSIFLTKYPSCFRQYFFKECNPIWTWESDNCRRKIFHIILYFVHNITNSFQSSLCIGWINAYS